VPAGQAETTISPDPHRTLIRVRRFTLILGFGLLAGVIAVAIFSKTPSGTRVAVATPTSPSGPKTATTKTATTKAPTSKTVTTGAGASTTTTSLRTGNGQAVTFAFGGDVNFEGDLAAKLASNPGGMFAPIAGELSSADIAMVNFESAITTRGSPDVKAFNFRTTPNALNALHIAGIDAVTEANNHGRDYGPVGLQDTLAAKAASPIPVLGVGANAAQAYAPWKTTVHGQRIAIFAATDVIDDSLISAWTATDTQPGLASTKGTAESILVTAIRAARPTTDTIVVYLHWGVEGTDCPSPRQAALAKTLTEAGADIVIGSHTHRVESGGFLGHAFVDYGLGNFAFYNESGLSGITGVLRITATGRKIDGYEWKPARIHGGIPNLVGGSLAQQDLAGFNGRRASCTNLAGSPTG
jgi:poly-gamma-glutamate capsule biosynthesis protein CapA/YwtB (metallophosphatase superfamily)